MNSKKNIILLIILFNFFFIEGSYSQFTNPLDSIFNEIGKGISNATKSISDGIQKSDEKNIDVKDENKGSELKENNKSATTTDDKKLEKKDKEYKPQCDNPKMAELLKKTTNDKKSLKENSQVDKNVSTSSKKRPQGLPKEITDQQWENLIKLAQEKQSSFISISKNSLTNKFYYGAGNDLNRADENSLLVCTRSGRGDCEVVFDFSMLETNVNSADISKQNNGFNQNINQIYSRDPLLNKFLESYNLLAQSQALLLEAYGKNQEAAIVRQSIADSTNPNKNDNEKFASFNVSVGTEKGNELKDLIYCRTEPLSAESKKKYQQAIPYATQAAFAAVQLKFMAGATFKNIKQTAQSDPLSAGLTALVYASYTPKVFEYLSNIGSTVSFIVTGGNANNIEGTPKLQSTLKDL